MGSDAAYRWYWRNSVPYFVIALLVTVAYGGALRNGYVWDDSYFFGNYVWVHDLKSAVKAAFDPLFGQRSYVRPIPLLMLYAEAIASGRNPAVAHAVNLVLHWGCSVLVFVIARRALTRSTPDHATAYPGYMPLLLASVFAVHPALSEAPIWISSRFDLMATLCFLSALWIAELSLRDTPRALALAALYFVGALCKESMAVFPFVLGTLALLRGSSGREGHRIEIRDAFSARELKAYSALFVAGLAYLLIRHQVLAGTDLLNLGNPSTTEWLSRVTTAVARYLQLTVLPFIGSSPHHTWVWPVDGSLATYWPAHAVTLAFLGITASLVIARRPTGWWLLAWLVAYLPVLHLVPLPIGQNVIHQRFMYLPTAMLLALAPFVLVRLRLTPIARKIVIGLMLLAILTSIPIDRSIARVWRSDLALWTWAVRTNPDSVEARENMVWAYLEADMYKEAEDEFKQIVARKMSTSTHLAVNMGTAMYRQGEFEGAMHYYRKAEAHQEGLSKSFRSRLLANLGITSAILGNASDARTYLLKALQENPRNQTAIGHLLGYCEGTDVDTSAFDPEDVERARPSGRETVSLIIKHQPSLQSERAFCPDH